MTIVAKLGYFNINIWHLKFNYIVIYNIQNVHINNIKDEKIVMFSDLQHVQYTLIYTDHLMNANNEINICIWPVNCM